MIACTECGIGVIEEEASWWGFPFCALCSDALYQSLLAHQAEEEARDAETN